MCCEHSGRAASNNARIGERWSQVRYGTMLLPHLGSGEALRRSERLAFAPAAFVLVERHCGSRGSTEVRQ